MSDEQKVFTEPERAYLEEQHLGRIATVSAKGEPDVAAVTFTVEPDDAVVIGGMDNTKTIKYRNVVATGRAAIVVDDLASIDPWAARGVKVRGVAEAVERHGKPAIRIVPETVWSWSLNEGADRRFGPIERREVGDPPPSR